MESCANVSTGRKSNTPRTEPPPKPSPYFFLTDRTMFRLFKDIATIHRQSYASGKSSFGATGMSCKGYLKPLSPENQQVGLDKYGKEFAFTTPKEADIRESDKLEIEGSFYRVKGVGNYSGLGLRFKRVLLVKE